MYGKELNIILFKKKKTTKEKTLKEREKESKRLGKKFHHTVDWIDVKGVSGQYIILGDHLAVFGVKITPPKDILTDEEQSAWAIRLSLVYSTCRLPIWHQMISSPVSVESHIKELEDQISDSNPEYINRLLIDEIENYDFVSSLPREEFFLLLKGDPTNSRFEKEVSDFIKSLRNARFDFTFLNERDFENYFAYVFENDLVNNFYFAHGVYEDLLKKNAPYEDILKEEDDV